MKAEIAEFKRRVENPQFYEEFADSNPDLKLSKKSKIKAKLDEVAEDEDESTESNDSQKKEQQLAASGHNNANLDTASTYTRPA